MSLHGTEPLALQMPWRVSAAADVALALGARVQGRVYRRAVHWRLTRVRGPARAVLAEAGWWSITPGVWAWAAN